MNRIECITISGHNKAGKIAAAVPVDQEVKVTVDQEVKVMVDQEVKVMVEQGVKVITNLQIELQEEVQKRDKLLLPKK